MADYTKFKDLLSGHLHQNERTGAWLAREIGVSNATTSRWLSDITKRPGKAVTIVKIVAALELNIQQCNELLTAAKYQDRFDSLQSDTSAPDVEAALDKIASRNLGSSIEARPQGLAVGSEANSSQNIKKLFGAWYQELEKIGGLDGIDFSIESIFTGLGEKTERLVLEARVTSLDAATNPAHSYFARGEQYYKDGKYELALAYYSEAIGIDSEFVDPVAGRGIVYYNQNDYESALNDFNNILEHNPESELAYYWIGLTYWGMGKKNLAYTNLNKVIGLNPQLVSPYIDRGRLHVFDDNSNAAISDFSRVIEINPHEYYGYKLRGLLYLALGDYEAALRDLKQSIRIAPEIDTYHALGRVCYDLKQHQEAIFYLTQAIDHDEYPRYRNLFLQRAEVHSELENYKKALSDIKTYFGLSEAELLQIMPTGNPREAFHKLLRRSAQEIIPERKAVILVNGRNIHHQEIFCYLQLPFKHYETVKQNLALEMEFDLRDYGEVLAVGIGIPDDDLVEKMRSEHDMIPIEPQSTKQMSTNSALVHSLEQKLYGWG